MAKGAIKLIIVDDHAILREGVRSIVTAAGDIEVVAEAANGVEAIERCASLRPDVILMDLQMPKMTGLAAIETILSRWPQTRIIVLTTYNGDAQAMRALRAGAAGYLLKNSMRTELVAAIRSVHEGGKHLDAETATGIALHAIQEPLTEREIETLALAAEGSSNKIIAGRLGVSDETVKGYMKAIFNKLEARDRTHAVAIAARRGIIEL